MVKGKRRKRERKERREEMFGQKRGKEWKRKGIKMKKKEK